MTQSSLPAACPSDPVLAGVSMQRDAGSKTCCAALTRGPRCDTDSARPGRWFGQGSTGDPGRRRARRPCRRRPARHPCARHRDGESLAARSNNGERPMRRPRMRREMHRSVRSIADRLAAETGRSVTAEVAEGPDVADVLVGSATWARCGPRGDGHPSGWNDQSRRMWKRRRPRRAGESASGGARPAWRLRRQRSAGPPRHRPRSARRLRSSPPPWSARCSRCGVLAS